MMPGGSAEAYALVEPIFTKIAAQGMARRVAPISDRMARGIKSRWCITALNMATCN